MGRSSFKKIILMFALFAMLTLFFSALASSSSIETPAYTIKGFSSSESVRIGNFIERSIKINNLRPNSVSVTLSPEGPAGKYIKIKNPTIVIEPGQEKEINISYLGDELGNFNGSIALTGGIIELIPVNLTVSAFVGTPVESILMEINSYPNDVYLGQEFGYELDIQNLLLEKKYNLTLTYSIVKSFEGSASNDSIFSEQEQIFLNTSLSLIKKFAIPEFVAPGDYALLVKADYLGLSTTSSAAFSVHEQLFEYKILGIPLKWLLSSIVLLILLMIAYLIYKKKKEKSKRYVSKLRYNLLPKLGPRTVCIGKLAESNQKAYFDIDQLTSHTLIAGSTGGGKTVSAEVLVEESLLKGAAVIVFDPTAQWTGFLRKCAEKKMLALYANFGMKPEEARAFNGNVHEIMNAREVIDIKKFVKPGEINSFAINRLDPKDIDILVANTMKQVFDANLPESKELKLLIIFDEVHRLLPKFGGSGEGFLQIERACREFRKWGVGLFLISQVLTDFVGETKANINTEIQMRTRDQGDLDRIKNKYGSYMLQSLLKASTGTGMLQNSAYNNGDPYFVSFRPLLHEHARLTDEELENYNKHNAMIDDLDFQVEELKNLGLDVFDMQLELKMALEKVKSGNFNMAKIYLEGLTPRVHGEFKNRGKPVPVRQIKLIAEEELKKEYEKAKRDREKAEKGESEVKEKKEEKEIPPLRLKTGIVVLSISELLDGLSTMNEATFQQHITPQKNEFADWIVNVDAALGDKVKNAKTKAELVAILTEAKNKPPKEKK